MRIIYWRFKKLLATSKWRIRIGFSIAVITLLAVVVSILLSGLDILRPHLPQIVIVLIVCGIILAVIGTWKKERLLREASSSEAASEAWLSVHPLAFFRRLDYWGYILLLCAPGIFFLTEYLSPPMKVAARPAVPVARPVRVEAPPKPVPVVVQEVIFPELKVEGMVCNGDRSSVVINRTTLHLGETVAGVTVVAIDSSGVTVEMAGRRKRLGSLP